MIDPLSGPPGSGSPRAQAAAASGGRVRAEAGNGAGFTLASPSGARAAGVGLSEISNASLAGMLALQEHEADTVRDRAAKRRGLDLLAALHGLQAMLLGGTADLGRLHALVELAQGVPEAADAGLRDLVADIALRAQIEIARFDLAA